MSGAEQTAAISEQGQLESVARLLEYPVDLDARKARGTADWIAPASARAADALRTFAASLEGLSIEELQELFTRTFDLSPTCSLEVGWHLYGEQYERGRFLVRMREELRRCGVRESRELPDHLTHVLRLLPRLEPQEARDFAERLMLPAMDRMLAAIPADNLYRPVLEAARHLVMTLDACPTEDTTHG